MWKGEKLRLFEWSMLKKMCERPFRNEIETKIQETKVMSFIEFNEV